METLQKPPPEKTEKKGQKKRIKTDRRFSDDQIKSLESIFKVETKLDTKKKLEVAKDLGLQPRQVAIWFQNKRARLKSKQLEQEYNVIKTSYDDLYMKFDDLKREKLSLQMQLQELPELVKNLDEVDSTDRDGEFKDNPNSSNEGMNHYENEYLLETGEEEIVGLFDHSPGTSNWWENE